MEMPKPTPGHAKLKMLEGDWEGEETMHPSQWDPEGAVATGRSRSRMALSGFALISDYEQERDGAVTFTGHCVMTFDPKEDVYSLHWFDCMGCQVEVFKGRFEGDVLTMSHGGPGMHACLTYDLSDPELMLSRMELSHDGTDWNPAFDGRYRKG